MINWSLAICIIDLFISAELLLLVDTRGRGLCLAALCLFAWMPVPGLFWRWQ